MKITTIAMKLAMASTFATRAGHGEDGSASGFGAGTSITLPPFFRSPLATILKKFGDVSDNLDEL